MVKSIAEIEHFLPMSLNTKENKIYISITGIPSLDKLIHSFVRSSIRLAAFLSKPPGVFLLFPSILLQHVPKLEVFQHADKWAHVCMALYWAIIAYYIFVSFTLYLISERPALRRKVCRYLDAPEVVYPDDFDEEKGREVGRKGFTFKQLSSVTSHKWRLLMVPIVFLCLTSPVQQWIAHMLLQF